MKKECYCYREQLIFRYAESFEIFTNIKEEEHEKKVKCLSMHGTSNRVNQNEKKKKKKKMVNKLQKFVKKKCRFG